ncbi:MAG TPA: mechanosensitive ion channel domain-containing protein [Vicinamibacteria bacterium]|nr:mechanosensitive ion channel domain-containing protein [Vicinamibacteria bacterium]
MERSSIARLAGPPALAAAVAALLAGTALAQGLPFGKRPASPGPTRAREAPVEVAHDSPRASLAAFLDLTRAGRYAQAARYLGLPEDQQDRGPELARRLRAVLDRHLWVEPEDVSPLSEGSPGDGQPPGVELLGGVVTGEGHRQPVRLVKAEDRDGPYWAFSETTADHIDQWYEELPDAWIHDRLPDALLRPGPAGMALWQWAALPVLVLLAWGMARILAALSRVVLARLTARTATGWDDLVVPRLVAPLTLAWAAAVLLVLLPYVALYAPAEQWVRQVVRAGWAVAVLWAIWRTIDVSALFFVGTQWGQSNPSARSLLAVGVRFTKVTVSLIAFLAAVAAFGVPVGTALAGLGLGGLAFALAAQKTAENLIGAVTLASDQPFREGDLVKVDDLVGHVETIGLRSTRFRTLDRTLVTLPNGRLADMRIESYAARDRFRLACTLALVYGTTAAQMGAVLQGLESVLRAHPRIWPDTVVVSFQQYGASSLDVEVMAWFQVADMDQFRLCRQEVLLGFMKVVEEAGTSFAFPTRTVHLAKGE